MKQLWNVLEQLLERWLIRLLQLCGLTLSRLGRVRSIATMMGSMLRWVENRCEIIWWI
jgi:hypothetical protein